MMKMTLPEHKMQYDPRDYTIPFEKAEQGGVVIVNKTRMLDLICCIEGRMVTLVNGDVYADTQLTFVSMDW